MEIRGIDVSAYNPVTDYKRVAGDGMKFAILRITERGNTVDSAFEKNYHGFREQGMKVGVYKYSYALTVEEARQEAQKVLEVMNGRALEFPVFYDVEWNQQRTLPKERITEIIREFRRNITDGGYPFGIYCNSDWYYNVLDTKALPYDYWLASYPYNDTGVIVEALRPAAGIGWQFSSRGQVPGITGDVDLDVFYKDDFKGQRTQKGDCIKFYDVWVGESTGNSVNVREDAGTDYPVIAGYPRLDKGNLVDVTGEKEDEDGALWYHVLIADRYRGYVRNDYIKRV